jgi:hypothetical protein
LNSDELELDAFYDCSGCAKGRKLVVAAYVGFYLLFPKFKEKVPDVTYFYFTGSEFFFSYSNDLKD